MQTNLKEVESTRLHSKFKVNNSDLPKAKESRINACMTTVSILHTIMELQH